MNSIISDFSNFNMEHLTLANPNGLQGGTYFTKLLNNNESLYIETPQCFTKSGIIKTDKKTYSDLLFNNNNSDFITFVQNLEQHVQGLIFDKKDLWFHNSIDMDDIENLFISPIKIYKGDKYLLRVQVQNSKLSQKKSLQIFDENEKEKTIEDVTKDSKVVSILEVQGVRFSSSSFQFQFILRQVMLLNNEPMFSKCLISYKKKTTATPSENIEQHTQNSNIEKEVETNIFDQKNEESNDILISESDNETENEETNQEESLKETNNSNNEKTDVIKDVDIDNIDNIENDINVNEDNNEQLQQNSEVNQENTFQNDNSEKSEPLEKNIDDLNNTNIINENQEEGTIESDNKTEGNKAMDNNEVVETQTKTSPDLNLEKLETVDLDSFFDNNNDSIKLKNPNEVYYEIYKEARKKAKIAKKNAIDAYLEAKNIRSTYSLNEIESSDDEFDEFVSMNQEY